MCRDGIAVRGTFTLNAGSELRLDRRVAGPLNFNSTATSSVVAVGSPTNLAKVTHRDSTRFYSVSLDGTVNLDFVRFQQLSTTGVTITNSATLSLPTGRLSNVRFEADPADAGFVAIQAGGTFLRVTQSPPFNEAFKGLFFGSGATTNVQLNNGNPTAGTIYLSLENFGAAPPSGVGGGPGGGEGFDSETCGDPALAGAHTACINWVKAMNLDAAPGPVDFRNNFVVAGFSGS